MSRLLKSRLSIVRSYLRSQVDPALWMSVASSELDVGDHCRHTRSDALATDPEVFNRRTGNLMPRFGWISANRGWPGSPRYLESLAAGPVRGSTRPDAGASVLVVVPCARGQQVARDRSRPSRVRRPHRAYASAGPGAAVVHSPRGRSSGAALLRQAPVRTGSSPVPAAGHESSSCPMSPNSASVV